MEHDFTTAQPIKGKHAIPFIRYVMLEHRSLHLREASLQDFPLASADLYVRCTMLLHALRSARLVSRKERTNSYTASQSHETQVLSSAH